MQWLEACVSISFLVTQKNLMNRRGFKLYDEDSLNTKLLTGENKWQTR